MKTTCQTGRQAEEHPQRSLSRTSRQSDTPAEKGSSSIFGRGLHCSKAEYLQLEYLTFCCCVELDRVAAALTSCSRADQFAARLTMLGRHQSQSAHVLIDWVTDRCQIGMELTRCSKFSEQWQFTAVQFTLVKQGSGGHQSVRVRVPVIKAATPRQPYC